MMPVRQQIRRVSWTELQSYCSEMFDKGWVTHQILKDGENYYVIFYKYD